MSVRILQGDCRDVLRTLPEASVHCVVSSPPYWGLRDYGTATWDGGDDLTCDHHESRPERTAASVAASTLDGGKGNTHRSHEYRGDCGRCGARRIDQQLGLEATPEEYIERMVEVFREVKRVLRDDGTCWLNLGDSLVDKQLQGMPWRVAFALQADGWCLRADIIWHKPNPMPESVTDRPTKSHEFVFLLTKRGTYFYDADAVREPSARPDLIGAVTRNYVPPLRRLPTETRAEGRQAAPYYDPAGRNLRSVWTIASEPFPEAHFATFPPALAARCIQAGTSDRGCCRACGASWVRVMEKGQNIHPGSSHTHDDDMTRGGTQTHASGVPAGTIMRQRHQARTATRLVDWRPSCACDADQPVPCTVLDPFGGSGTMGMVAEQLGRHSVLIELSPEYVQIAKRRTAQRGLFTQQEATDA